MIRPTSRMVGLTASALPASLLVIGIDQALWPLALALLAAVMAALVADHVQAARPLDLKIEASPPDVLEIGAPSRLGITVDTGRVRRPAWLELTVDAGDLVETIPWKRIDMPVAGTVEPGLSLAAHRRGVSDAVVLWLRWQGPFGLSWRHHEVELAEKVTILPDASAARRLGIQLRNRHSDPGLDGRNPLGAGTDFEALREHMQGMDGRAIDWKHSARHRKLLSKECRPESNHRIVLSVDCGYLMRAPLAGMPRLDHAVRAALAMIYAALAAGDRAGLYGLAATPGSYVEPVAGLARFPLLRRAAANLDYRSEETNFTLGLAHLGTRLKHRALVVLMTDFIDATSAELMVESLSRMARHHLVLFVALADPALNLAAKKLPDTVDDVARSVIAGDLLRDRRLVLERLQRRGVHCLEARPDQLVAALVARYLGIRQLELI